MDAMKALVLFTSFAVILWTCATVTAQDELNTTCTLTPVITDQLKTKLFEYFDKSSETKLLEYKLVFDNYTKNQQCKDSATSFEHWRWYRAQEFGSLYFFFLDKDIWTNGIMIKNVTASVEIQFKTTPENCLVNLTCRGQQTLIRNALISDFNLRKELQRLDIELSKNIEICLNVNENDMFENYRCCGFNRWNEYYCNDQSVYFKIVFFYLPFIISIPIMVYILYKLWLSYRTIKFGIYSEANTEINKWKKIKCRLGESAHRNETVLASKFITLEGSTWLLFDYYIYKLFFFFAGHSADNIFFCMPRLKNSANADPKTHKKSCWKLIFFPNIDSPSFFTLLMEIFLLTFPFVVLGIERIIKEDYAWGSLCFVLSIIICCIFGIFVHKTKRRVFLSQAYTNKYKIVQHIVLICVAAVIYSYIFWYVKLIFKLIALAFLKFEKADVIISTALVVVIYLYGVFETTNLQLKMCLRAFKDALDDMVITNRHERTKDFIFLLECEGSRTDNQDVTSNIYDNYFHAITERSVLLRSSSRNTLFTEFSDDPESNMNIDVKNKLPLFYDTEGNLYVWKDLFYSYCRRFFDSQPKSSLTKIAMVTMSCILSCYILMLGMLVWYFEDFYDYSFLKTVFIIIAGGLLPKVLGMVFGARLGDVPLQNTDNRFQIFVQKEIEAIYKKASVSGAPPQDVGLPLQNTFNGFELSVRKEIESIYKIASKNVLLFVGRTGNGKSSSIRSILKDGTTEPGTSTTAPGTSTTAPGTSTTAPGTSTTAPGTSTTAPGTSTTVPGTSTTAPGTSTTAPGTSTTASETSNTAPDPSTTAPGTSTTATDPSTTAPGTSTIQPGSDTTTLTVGDLEMINGTGIGDNGEDMIVNAEDLVKSITRNLTNGFTALVFVVKYGVRFTKQEMDAVETVKSIFGNDVFEKWGIILMTYGDNFYLDHDDDPNSFKAWCRAQNGDFKNLFDECNERCVLFNNKTTDPLELENQRELLMKHVEAVRKLSSGLYTCAHLKSAEWSRNCWARKNKGKVTYHTFN